MYISNDDLQKRINEIAAQAGKCSHGIIRYEERIALPHYGAIILRFSLTSASVSLEELDRCEALLYDIVGDEFLVDFMGSEYRKAGVSYDYWERTLENLADKYQKETWKPTIHAEEIRSDAKELLRAAGLEPNLPVWEIQPEDDETLVLILGEAEKNLAQTTEAGRSLRVMEIPEKPCRGLFLAACCAKRNGVSLGRLLSEQFSGEHYAASI